MRVLWLYANVPSDIIEKYELQGQNGGGWVSSLMKKVIADNRIELGVCYPFYTGNVVKQCMISGVAYYPFFPESYNELKYDQSVEGQIKCIITDFVPDVLHVFGTETQHALPAIKAFNNPEKTVINLQGMTGIVSKHYYSNLSWRDLLTITFKDFIKRNSMIQQKRIFEKRAVFEKESLCSVAHVIGRTEWDRCCSLKYNPKLNYYHCDEILRDSFYAKKWDYDKCEKYSLFMSQAWYPVKGLHYVLEALVELKKKYPAIKLYIAGDNFIETDSLRQKIRLTSYGKYIKRQIRRNGLQDQVVFTGPMNSEQISDFMLKMNTVLVPSTIENESNTLSEAKIMGVPSIASFVGGMTERIEHGVDGFQYQHDAIYMLEYYMEQLFTSEDLCRKMSENAISKARSLCDREKNVSVLYSIYHQINERIKSN